MAYIAVTKLFIIFASGDIIQTIASESNKKIRMKKRSMNRTIKRRDFRSMLESHQQITILDVRRKADYDAAMEFSSLLSGAIQKTSRRSISKAALRRGKRPGAKS
jgi:hypothetical protein